MAATHTSMIASQTRSKFVVLLRLAASHDNEAECELPRTILLDMMEHGLPPGGTSVRIGRRDPSWMADAEPSPQVSQLLPEPLAPPLLFSVVRAGLAGPPSPTW